MCYNIEIFGTHLKFFLENEPVLYGFRCQNREHFSFLISFGTCLTHNKKFVKNDGIKKSLIRFSFTIHKV